MNTTPRIKLVAIHFTNPIQILPASTVYALEYIRKIRIAVLKPRKADTKTTKICTKTATKTTRNNRATNPKVITMIVKTILTAITQINPRRRKARMKITKSPNTRDIMIVRAILTATILMKTKRSPKKAHTKIILSAIQPLRRVTTRTTLTNKRALNKTNIPDIMTIRTGITAIILIARNLSLRREATKIMPNRKPLPQKVITKRIRTATTRKKANPRGSPKLPKTDTTTDTDTTLRRLMNKASKRMDTATMTVTDTTRPKRVRT